MLRFFSLLLLLALAASSVSGYLTERGYQREFTKFVKAHSKRYTTDDFFQRYDIFKSNLDAIELHNAQAQPGEATMAINAFADLTAAEFSSRLGYRAPANRVRNVVPLPDLKVASSLDWNAKGAVTAIKDQGSCGSCWAFSTTGSVEGAVFLKSGNLTSLSEQQLMDCSTKEGDESCDGGLMDYAFQYILDNKGICAETDYPYKMKNEKCVKTCHTVTTISDFADVDSDPKHPDDESALMTAVNLGPVSVAVEADQAIWQLYSSGVIKANCGTKLDHGVLITGYGTDSSVDPPIDYWTVKNSWGPKWGEKGYLRIVRNKNMCGINLAASYPIA